jgi:hypothetical protein
MWNIVVSVWESLMGFLTFFKPVLDFVISTKVPEQIENIKYQELFTNGWFLTPYLALIAWNIFRKQIYTIIIILLFSGSWAFFGTPYMQDVMQQDQIQLETILPLVGGACVVLGITVYLIFFKSE